MSDEDSDIVQRLERSIDYWVDEREDYPPAIRGTAANLTDLNAKVAAMVATIAADPQNPDATLNQILWFDDKNGKLDEACEEAKIAFMAYAVNSDGLVSWSDRNNPVLEESTRHRLTVSDEFAATNYQQQPAGADLFVDQEEAAADNAPVKPNSWKRKITQTLSPWKVKVKDKIVPARRPDDLMLTLNALFSRTKHGWLVADMQKLKKRRGSMMIYARTLEYQKVDDKRFEFMIQLFGAASEFRRRMAATMKRTACLYLETDNAGNAFLTKSSTYHENFKASIPPGAKHIEIPIDVTTNDTDGTTSQLQLVPTGKYFDAKILPLLNDKKRMVTKFDLRKSNSEQKFYSFRVNVHIERPLLIASSGDAVIFQFDDFLKRFCDTELAALKSATG